MREKVMTRTGKIYKCKDLGKLSTDSYIVEFSRAVVRRALPGAKTHIAGKPDSELSGVYAQRAPENVIMLPEIVEVSGGCRDLRVPKK